MKKPKKNRLKYKIVIFRNNKLYKVLHSKVFKETILRNWDEESGRIKPRFYKEAGKRGKEVKFELALLFPRDKVKNKIYIKDDIGRNKVIDYVNEDFNIKKIIPYYMEEMVFDFDISKHVRYRDVLSFLLNINEFTQLYTLNNKVIIQNDDMIKMYGNVNIFNAQKLFNLLKEDLIKKEHTNFLFVKDVTTHQRLLLYEMLEAKGFKRSELIRHYSY